LSSEYLDCQFIPGATLSVVFFGYFSFVVVICISLVRLSGQLVSYVSPAQEQLSSDNYLSRSSSVFLCAIEVTPIHRHALQARSRSTFGAVHLGNVIPYVVSLVLMVWCGSAVSVSQTKAVTTTALAISSGSTPVSTVTSGSVVTLTATVTTGSTPVSPGRVNFCDATAAYCTDVHILGTAQLTASGKAVQNFRPGLGSHSYKAVFVGTNTNAASSSTAAALTVTGVPAPASNSTALGQTGTLGAYSLTATITGTGSDAPLSGAVSFVDITSGTSVLTTAQLGAGTPGMTWVNTQLLTGISRPQYETVGDFNGDGIPDVAVVNQTLVYILIGKGDGTFTIGTTLGVSGSPEQLVAADFNGDGKLDLAVVNYGATGTAAIFLGNGDGTFTAVSSSASTGTYPLYITTADFNGDGIADLAVGSSFTGTVAVLLGNGDGTFSSTLISLPNVPNIGAMVSGDFNGDGEADLAVQIISNNQLIVLTGNGDGTFATWSTTDLGSYSSAMAVADFNGDGRLDLVATSIYTSAVTVLLNNGDGTFALNKLGGSVPTEPTWVSVGDFNGDRIPDVAYVQAENDFVYILLGKGDGTFIDPGVRPAAGTSYLSSPYSIGVGDFNGDGKDDLVVPINSDGTINTYLSEPTRTASVTAAGVAIVGPGLHHADATYAGNSSFQSGVSNTIALWGEPPSTTTTLAITSGGSPVTTVASGSAVTLSATVSVGPTPLATGVVTFCDATASVCTGSHFFGNAALNSSGTAAFKFIPAPGQHSFKAVLNRNATGAGSSSAASPLTVTAPAHVTVPTTTTIVQSGAINNYTLTSTVVGVGSSAPLTGSVSFLDTSYSNKSLATVGVGTSTAGLAFPIASSTAFSKVGFLATAVGDFNGDGILDIAAVNTNTMTVTVLLGNGDGTFKTTAGPTLSSYTTTIVAADFNGDGKLDLAISLMGPNFSANGSIAILLGNGDGTFAVSSSSPAVANSPGVIAASDINADGRMDLVVNDSTGTRILLGNGDGTFSQGPATGLLASLAVADFNGDGFPDLITNAEVALGNGDGTFRPAATSIPLASPPPPAIVADFNGDGIPDVAIIGSFYSPVTIYMGNGDGTFTTLPPGSNPSVNEPGGIVATDLNHDGKLDLVITNWNSYTGNIQNPDLTILLGKGDGTFTAIPGDIQLPATWAIAAADFNGDGTPDLAVGTTAGVSVLLTEPSQTATVTVNGVWPAGPAPHVVDASYSGDTNFKASSSATVLLDVQVATPVFTPASGTYTSAETVTITDTTPGATLYYYAGTASPPVWTPYNGPIIINTEGSFYFQAYATAPGYEHSTIAAATYTLNLPPAPAPVISPGSGGYAGPQTVTITDSAPGITIYFTTDGSIPTANSTKYTGPIIVSISQTVAAVAAGAGYNIGPTASAQIYINSAASAFIYTIAGSGSWGYGGDNGPATTAVLNDPGMTLVDAAGNLYISDTGNSVVRKVDAKTGIITTVAGGSIPGYAGDGGLATKAQIQSSGIAFDAAGNLYISDYQDGVVRKVDASTGIITTIAGNTTATAVGDNGPATIAMLSSPAGLAIDSAGNLYIATYTRIRKVNLNTGIITTYAGTGTFGSGGDGGPANIAVVGQPWGIAVDSAGTLYFTDVGANLVRKITAAGTILPVAGLSVTQATTPIGDGGPATSAIFSYPEGLIVDGSGNVFIADTDNAEVRVVSATTGIINKLIGYGPNVNCVGLSGDGGPAGSSGTCAPLGVTLDAAGNLYIAEAGSSRIRKITAAALPPTSPAAAPVFNVQSGSYPTPQTVTLTSSTPGAAFYVTFDGTTPTTLSTMFHSPINVTGSMTINALAVAPGFLPSAVSSASYTITMPPSSIINTVAGTGTAGPVTAGAPAISEGFGWINGLGLDSAGNLYIPDQDNCVVWMVSASSGKANVVAGALGYCGENGDGGLATSASLAGPTHVAFDGAGNLYIADSWFGKIRKVDATTGLISTFAGNGYYGFNLGDNGPATAAYLAGPKGLAFDSAGNLYIADTGNGRVRKVDTGGIITTYAGGNNSALGDGGPATSASLSYPLDVALDSAGNLYIADQYHGRVRMVAAQTGVISTFAGNGDLGTSGDGLPATSAEVYPLGIASDSAGNLYVTNFPNTVRMINAATKIITTIAGSSYSGFSGDGGPPTAATLCEPYAVAAAKSGNLYIADTCNYRVREITFPTVTPAPVLSLPAGTYSTAQTVTITDSLQNATIYYTNDGSTPNVGSTVFSGPITISASETVNAIAVASGNAESTVASAAYLIAAVAATPVFNPPAGTYTGTQSVTVTSSSIGAAIYYTTDGSTPTTASAQYSNSITVAASEIIKAIATGPGYTPSAVASASYVINNAAPVLTGLSPAIASAGGAGFTLTASGTGFSSASTIQWGSSTLATQFLNPTTLTASIPASSVASPGIATVAVQTPAPGGGISNTMKFEVDTAGTTPPNFTTLTATISTGSTASYAVSLPALATNVTVSCLNLPAGASCTYAAGTVSIPTSATTPAGTYQVTIVFTEILPGAAAAWIFLPILTLPLAAAKRRVADRFLLIALFGLALTTAIAGCGGGGGGGTTTPPATHQVTSSGVVTLMIQ
jgi:sugar lactone lactonase YvrE